MLKKIFISGMACLLVSSCGFVASPLIPGSQAAAAKDQIMLVRKTPPSFGYQRLLTQTDHFPDLGIFVKKHGIPDFLAETGNSERRYFILYYLGSRHAFACRTQAGSNQSVEFAGPYPITQGEFKLLNGFRRNAAKSLER